MLRCMAIDNVGEVRCSLLMRWQLQTKTRPPHARRPRSARIRNSIPRPAGYAGTTLALVSRKAHRPFIFAFSLLICAPRYPCRTLLSFFVAWLVRSARVFLDPIFPLECGPSPGPRVYSFIRLLCRSRGWHTCCTASLGCGGASDSQR